MPTTRGAVDSAAGRDLARPCLPIRCAGRLCRVNRRESEQIGLHEEGKLVVVDKGA